jgi:hypothetical protein
LNEVIRKNMTEIKFETSNPVALGDRMYLRVDPEDFDRLYHATSFASSSSLQDRIFSAAKVSTGLSGDSGGANNGGNGGDQGLPPVSGNNSTDEPDKTTKDKEKTCEIEPAVCVSPTSGKSAIELELKCKGLPLIVVSTNGDVNVKLGPISLPVLKIKD